jgi:hypothetical protein
VIQFSPGQRLPAIWLRRDLGDVHHRVMRLALAIVVLLVPGLAHADRTTIVNIGAGIGVLGDVDATAPGVMFAPRATLAWEDALLPIPAEPGTHDIGGALVPEIVVGSLFEEDRAEGFVGVGIRAELKMSQNAMGLLKWTTRGAGYLSARGLVVGETRDVAYEFGVGQYFAKRTNFTRFGYEIQVMHRPHWQQTDSQYLGFLFSLYVGWAP